MKLIPHAPNTNHLYNIYATSAQRLRRWSNILQMVLDCLLFQYMLTHGTKLAEIDFFVFLTIFEYVESHAQRCQAQILMQRLELFDLKLVQKIVRKFLNSKV